MADEEKWIDATEAIVKVRNAFNSSQGAAENTLRKICKSGEVRLQELTVIVEPIGGRFPGPVSILSRVRPQSFEDDGLTPGWGGGNGFPANLRINESDLNSWLTAQPPRKKPDGEKRGRKELKDWANIERRAHEIMDDEGQFDLAVAEWNCPERLAERLLLEFEVGRSTLLKRLPGICSRWRVDESHN